MITCGSLFAGIGGFELGAKWAFEAAGIPHKVLFQVEQNKFCQTILNKHWPDAQIFNDICEVGSHNLPDVDILMGGFPCTDISVAGLQRGIINGKKSNLWLQMLRIISELRPRIAVLENVPNIIRVGGTTVIGGLTEIGYGCEWAIVSASQFGAPHLRKRWFCVATDTDSIRSLQTRYRRTSPFNGNRSKIQQRRLPESTDTDSAYIERNRCSFGVRTEKTNFNQSIYPNGEPSDRWKKFPTEPPLCNRNDGISNRLARLRALGNAIVPQCSEYIFQNIIQSKIF